MPTRNLLAFIIATVAALACNRKNSASDDSTAVAVTGGPDTSATSTSEPPASAAADDSVPVSVTITLSGGRLKDDGTYRASGKASLCEHVLAPRDKAAEWTIMHGGGGSGPGAADVELKVGKVTGGTSSQLSAQITVIRTDGLPAPHFINTFAGTVTTGLGTVKVTPQGAGARFDLSGVDAEKTQINATIICDKLNG